MLSMPRNFSAFSTPLSLTATVLCFSSASKSKSASQSLALASIALRLLAAHHARRELGELVVDVRRLLGLARDDQRGARLVDEDVVDLVDDREAVAALSLLLHLDREVVAQVVEAELGVGAVGDVAVVRRLPLGLVHSRLDDPDADAEQAVDRCHPGRVAAGEVVVDGDQVHALAVGGLAVLVARRDRVQDDRQRGGQGLALAGAHLGDRAVVQHHAADQLDVEVALAERALAGLAGEREGLVQEVVERLAGVVALAQRRVARAQLLVALKLQLGLEVVDAHDVALEDLELLALADA